MTNREISEFDITAIRQQSGWRFPSLAIGAWVNTRMAHCRPSRKSLRDLTQTGTSMSLLVANECRGMFVINCKRLLWSSVRVVVMTKNDIITMVRGDV